MLWDSNKAGEGTHQATVPWFVWHGLYGRAMLAKLHGEGAHQSLMARTGLMKVHIRQCFCTDEALWEQM